MPVGMKSLMLVIAAQDGVNEGTAGVTSWKQYVKAFLREMAVVREHVCETCTAHHLHRHTICEAVFLVGTGLVESKTCKEELTGLWDDCHVWRGKKTMDSQRRSLAEIRFSGAVGRKVLVEYRIRGIQVMRGKRLGERDHTPVPLVGGMQQRDPIKNIGEQASHNGRFGVP